MAGWPGFFHNGPRLGDSGIKRAARAFGRPDRRPAASIVNANPAHDHNLNLVDRDPFGGIHRPWVLDPMNPTNAATTGVDATNNVEQVTVLGPAVATILSR